MMGNTWLMSTPYAGMNRDKLIQQLLHKDKQIDSMTDIINMLNARQKMMRVKLKAAHHALARTGAVGEEAGEAEDACT